MTIKHGWLIQFEHPIPHFMGRKCETKKATNNEFFKRRIKNQSTGQKDEWLKGRYEQQTVLLLLFDRKTQKIGQK